MYHYVEELGKFRENNKNLKFTSSKKKILVLGDSHGNDTYDALILNKNLLKDFEVVFNKVDNLNFVLKERDKNYKNKIYHFKNNNDANIVILSYLWSKNLNKSNIELLKNFLKI